MAESYSYYLNKEKSNFNIIRLLCAVLVIYGHSNSLIFNELSGGGDSFMKIFGLPPAAVGVKSFFFLSGLLVVNSLLSYKDLFIYAVKRLFRIFPALIFVIVISTFVIGPLCTKLNIHDYFSANETWNYIAKNISLRIWGNNDIGLPGVFIENKYPVSVNAPLWAISAECFAYVIIFALFAVCLFSKKAVTILCGVIIADYLMQKSLIFYWIPKDNSDLAAIPFCYALGILLAVNKDKIKIDWLFPLGSLILLHIFTDCFFTDALKYITVFSTFVCLAKSKFLVNLPKMPDLSYGIFLFGWPLQQLVCSYLTQANYFISLGLTLILSIMFAYITYRFIERPSLSLQNKILNLYHKKMKEA